MKYFLVILIIVFAVISNMAPIKSFRLPYATSEPAPTLSLEGVEGKACTEKGVRPYGFPFRTNLYDECEQDTSAHIVALSVNAIIWVSLATFVFIRLSKRKS